MNKMAMKEWLKQFLDYHTNRIDNARNSYCSLNAVTQEDVITVVRTKGRETIVEFLTKSEILRENIPH